MPDLPTADLLGRLGLEGLPPLLVLAAGMLLILFGRRIYWLLVGLAGFALGFVLVLRYADLPPGPAALIAGAVVGVICAVVVSLFQKVALASVGFVAGGLAMLYLAATLGWEAGGWIWIAALAAAVAGALLARSLFELALAVATSIAGAVLVAATLGLAPATESILVIALAGLGILVQLKSGGESARED